MIQWVAIGVVGIGILGGITGSAPRAIDLMQGQTYRTGSPLSQPGVVGLVGGIAGTHAGGGYEVWQGPHVAASADVLNVSGSWVQVGGVVKQPTSATYTQAQAHEAQANVDWSTVDNRPRAIIPDCAGQQLFVTYAPDAEIGAVAQYQCK